ncbi:hypothetical protein CPC08DRAFT_597414, partial [Agrocybe pediades]
QPESAEAATTVGSFEYDLQSGGYNLRWKNISEMEMWIAQEEEKSMIEYKRHKTKYSLNPSVWSIKYIRVCGRSYSGGKDSYKRKHNWLRKVPVKRLEECKVWLTIKIYPYTSEVLGRLTGEHSHPIGKANTCYTRLRKETRVEIERLLRL